MCRASARCTNANFAQICDLPLTLWVRDSREFSLTLFDNLRKLRKFSVPSPPVIMVDEGIFSYSMKYFVYILEAKDGFLYTGTTKNLEERIARHNRGGGGRFTKGRRPLKLIYYEELNSLKSAMAREILIKRLSRSNKQELIAQFKIRKEH